jgi:hypothetical protein
MSIQSILSKCLDTKEHKYKTIDRFNALNLKKETEFINLTYLIQTISFDLGKAPRILSNELNVLLSTTSTDFTLVKSTKTIKEALELKTNILKLNAELVETLKQAIKEAE